MNSSRISLTAILAAVAVGVLVSCDPVEPSTYNEQFFRIGTVKTNSLGTTAYITMDATMDEESATFDIRNFRTESDMKQFGLKPNDRVIAALEFNAVGTMANSQITLNRVQKLEISKFATEKPADSLNYDYFFKNFTLVNVPYPSIWATGHYVNIAPLYYIPESGAQGTFYLDPVVFRADTVFARLYSYIPEIDNSQSRPSQSLLCYDMSSLRERSSNTENQCVRDSILSGLSKMKNKDSFTLTIVTPDSLRTYSAGVVRWRRPMLDHAVSVSVKFDF